MCRYCVERKVEHTIEFFGRRDFLKVLAAASAVAAVTDLRNPRVACARGTYPSVNALLASMGIQRIARLTPLGYQSKPAVSDKVVKWVQVDLGQSRKIDQVKLMPMLDFSFISQRFPRRFRIEASDNAQFHASQIIADYTKADYPSPGDKVAIFSADGVTGRYVRVTATLLTGRSLALSKLEVWSDGRDVAQGCRVTDVDSVEIFDASADGDITPAPLARGAGADQAAYEQLRAIYPTMPAYPEVWPNGPFAPTWPISGIFVAPLTRKPRPQGEGVVTDNPGNVIPSHHWRPMPFLATAPLRGVEIGDGLFKTVMENNIDYLLNSFTVPELLRYFRTRAGKPNPPGLPPDYSWDAGLPGSNAGRFLMGAGNTLRWIDHPELRRRLNEVVAGIADCQEPNGYAMAYAEDTIFAGEHGNYTRSWVTHGLVEAGYAGNQTAFRILRGFYDWFDQCPYLPELLRRAGQGVQGMIANTRTYFTPIGKPKDIQVIQRYYQENYWLEMLAKRDPAAIWQYPYDHPHCYLLTSITPYLDQYRATGEKKYLDAVLGGWELYHTQWQHIGGAISICEVFAYPPKSAFLNLRNGENCGSSFWISLNHGLHQLFPTKEKYTYEIEKSLYNVLIANQDGTIGIRYHTNLNGRKEVGTAVDTCCEGQGTRQFGSLPEYIYSVARDGLYVNLFANSSIQWRHARQALKLEMNTEFPFRPEVKMRLSMAAPVRTNIRVRIPIWADAAMPIHINGTLAATGQPGTYQPLDRVWSDDDTITFTLPMAPRLSLYTGIDQVPTGRRYGLEYGPILLAVVATNENGNGHHDSSKAVTSARNIPYSTQVQLDAVVSDIRLPVTAEELVGRLKPVSNHPLHFYIEGVPNYQYVPYWQINDESFTCFPVLKTPESYSAETVGPNDLALARKGAIATSDSELPSEPGGTAKVIDGIIATPANFATNRWHSASTPHPHWVQVKLPQAEKIGKVVIDFADPLDHPTSFQGVVWIEGREQVIFDVTNYQGWRKYTANIEPVITDKFRLIIRDSASPLHPNAAQISQIELCPPEATVHA
ncbi:MAG: glycoside hydrolase family 127 protein [Planctomycetes bacterium]|nr:glycoside hydrolase family 127 protein [Planctomycetota bacterium]